MYVGRRYEASVVTSEATRFSCMHCNYECDAMVTGIGEGQGRSAYFLDNDGARDRAQHDAAGDARANMHFALRGATCPSCKKHDAGARRYVYLTSALRGLVIGALLGAVVLVLCKGSTFGWGAGIATIGVVTAIMTITRSQRMLTGAVLHPDPSLALRR